MLTNILTETGGEDQNNKPTNQPSKHTNKKRAKRGKIFWIKQSQKVPFWKVFRDIKREIYLVLWLTAVIVRNTETPSGKSFTSAVCHRKKAKFYM